MSALSGIRKRLDPGKVYLAQEVAKKKIELAKQMVLERAKQDAEFAADLLKAVENLPEDFKAECEKSIANAKTLDNIHLGDGMVAVQSDGGGPLIVHETELPDYPRDGK